MPYISKDLNDALKFHSSSFSIGLLDDNNIYTWQVIIFRPNDTLHEGAIYEFFFKLKMWHPNIEVSGKVCISILHESGDELYGYESFRKRWNRIFKSEYVIMSIISILDNPNCESPANVDAANDYLNNRSKYCRKVRTLVSKSTEEFQKLNTI